MRSLILLSKERAILYPLRYSKLVLKSRLSVIFFLLLGGASISVKTLLVSIYIIFKTTCESNPFSGAFRFPELRSAYNVSLASLEVHLSVSLPDFDDRDEATFICLLNLITPTGILRLEFVVNSRFKISSRNIAMNDMFRTFTYRFLPIMRRKLQRHFQSAGKGL